MGTSCNLIWRVADELERIWVVAPSHPIAAGLDRYIELEREEMYGEFFDVPPPEELVFLSWFPGGEVFRSGCCYTRGSGKIFYFRPGHESYPDLLQRRCAEGHRQCRALGRSGRRPGPGLRQPGAFVAALTEPDRSCSRDRQESSCQNHATSTSSCSAAARWERPPPGRSANAV